MFTLYSGTGVHPTVPSPPLPCNIRAAADYPGMSSNGMVPHPAAEIGSAANGGTSAGASAADRALPPSSLSPPPPPALAVDRGDRPPAAGAAGTAPPDAP